MAKANREYEYILRKWRKKKKEDPESVKGTQIIRMEDIPEAYRNTPKTTRSSGGNPPAASAAAVTNVPEVEPITVRTPEPEEDDGGFLAGFASWLENRANERAESAAQSGTRNDGEPTPVMLPIGEDAEEAAMDAVHWTQNSEGRLVPKTSSFDDTAYWQEYSRQQTAAEQEYLRGVYEQEIAQQINSLTPEELAAVQQAVQAKWTHDETVAPAKDQEAAAAWVAEGQEINKAYDEALALLEERGADRLLTALKQDYNATVRTQRTQEAAVQAVQEGMLGANIGTVLGDTVAAVPQAVDLWWQDLRNRRGLGEWAPIDYYGGLQQQGVLSDAVRGETSRKLELRAGPLASGAYGLGMSALDSVASTLAAGGNPLIAAAITGSGAGAQSAREAHEAGADDATALQYGAAIGAVEGLSNVVDVGTMTSAYRSVRDSASRGTRNFLLGRLANAGEEGLSEALTEAAEIALADDILGEYSENGVVRAQMRAGGASEEEIEEAIRSDNARRILRAGLGGAVMGPVFDLGGRLVGGVVNMATGADVDAGAVDTANADVRAADADAGAVGADVQAAPQAADAMEAEAQVQMLPAGQDVQAQTVELPTGDAMADGTEAQQAPLEVGRNTRIQRPYTGETPVNRQNAQYRAVDVADADVQTAAQQIEAARNNPGKSIRKSLTEFYRKAVGHLFNGREVPVENASFEDRPYNVTLNKNVIGKVISDRNLNAEKLAIFNNIDAVVRNAEYLGSGEYVAHGAKQKDVTRYDYFETQANINGRPYTVSFDVEVSPASNNYRTHRVIDNIKIEPVGAAGSTSTKKEGLPPVSAVRTAYPGTDTGPVPAAAGRGSSPSTNSIAQPQNYATGNLQENADAVQSGVQMLPTGQDVQAQTVDLPTGDALATGQTDARAQALGEQRSVRTMDEIVNEMLAGQRTAAAAPAGQSLPAEAPAGQSATAAAPADAAGVRAQDAGAELAGNGRYGPNTVGAAQVNEHSYSHLQNEYGTIEPGENPSRTVDVPRRTEPGNRVRRFTRTEMEASATPDALIEHFERGVENGDFSYNPKTDKAALESAVNTIQTHGFDGAMERWNAVVDGQAAATKNTLVLGQVLYAEAAKAGDTQTAMKLAADLALEATKAGQSVQSLRMLKRLTPEGKLYYLRRTVDNLNAELASKATRKGVEPAQLEIKPELAERLLRAKDGKEAGEAANAITRDVAQQMPATWLDKWNAWRYLAMLGNPRTHIRNVIGNAAFVPARTLKNVIGTAMERVALKPGQRSKAVLNRVASADRARLDFGRQDFAEMSDVITGTGKLNPTQMIEKEKPIFQTKWLEALRKGNDRALEAEDMVFLRSAYATSMAQYMKANQLTQADMKGKTLETARSYAINEAQKATYRDASAIASKMNDLKRSTPAGDVILNGILPFTKTPINVLKRGVEYSPINVLKGLTYDVHQVRKGNMTASQMIDDIAAGASGSMVTAIGYWLASMGLLAGGMGSGKDDKYAKDRGAQEYALTIGDKSYTLDWAAPTSLPLFVGVELYKQMQNGGDWTLETGLDALSMITEPLFEMSMLQGIAELVGSFESTDAGKITSALTNAVSGYFSQAVPTLFGQVARSVDGTRRNAYYNDKTNGMPYALESIINQNIVKLPILSETLPAYIDVWGNEKQNTGDNVAERLLWNMLSPGYYSETQQTPVDEEVQRLYDLTGDAAVLPSAAEKSFSLDGKTYQFTADEYEQYAKEKGQTQYEVAKALIELPLYQAADKDAQVEMVQDVYDYARYAARRSYDPDYVGTGWTADVYNAAQYGVKPEEVILHREMADANRDGRLNKAEVVAYLDGQGLSREEKRTLFGLLSDAKNPYA